MNVALNYACKPINNFADLLSEYPDSQFNSPRRSTVPLLAYWKNAAARCVDLFGRLGLEYPASVDLTYEHEVPVDETNKAKGKPSCTDLMICCDGVIIAIEGKYREPKYETVGAWLAKGDRSDDSGTEARPPLGHDQPTNRQLVLEGWLGMINRATGSDISQKDVSEITYQTIHRTASACHPYVRQSNIRRFMLYQCFVDEGVDQKYLPDLSALQKLAPSTSLRLGCLSFPTERLAAFKKLETKWDDARERQLSADVKGGLLRGDLFAFAEPHVHLV